MRGKEQGNRGLGHGAPEGQHGGGDEDHEEGGEGDGDHGGVFLFLDE